MMKLDKIYTDIIPYGVAKGVPGFFMEFVECEGEGDADFMSQLKALIAEKQPADIPSPDDPSEMVTPPNPIEVVYNRAINGKHKAFFFVKDKLGKLLAKENINSWSTFWREISKESLALQEGVVLDRKKPPYIIYECAPTIYTGSENLYQWFNNIYCIISDENIGAIPYHQAMQHQFSRSYYIVDGHDKDKNGKDIGFCPTYLVDKVSDLMVTDQLTVIDASDDPEAIKDFCMANEFRYDRSYAKK